MKKIIPLISFVLFILVGCKKTVENIQEDLVIKAMTDGQWEITSFTVNGNNITADFTNYRFKYYSNKTVDAINNGIVEKTGQWDGNAANMTTWANFNGAVYPLTLVNGSWQINNNSWTYVVATQVAGPDTRVMRLEKR